MSFNFDALGQVAEASIGGITEQIKAVALSWFGIAQTYFSGNTNALLIGLAVGALAGKLLRSILMFVILGALVSGLVMYTTH